MTNAQITATISAITDLMQALRHAATEEKAEVYAGLKLQLPYHLLNHHLRLPVFAFAEVMVPDSPLRVGEVERGPDAQLRGA
jgi:hypothetical protein